MELNEKHWIAAAERWQARESDRKKNKNHLKDRDITKLETSDRIQKREAHLKRKAQEQRPSITADTRDELQKIFGYERVLGDDDTVGPDFFEMATAVSRYVGRIRIFDNRGRLRGYGTGFMVSPRLMMTNNHVLEDAGQARTSRIQFDYQMDRYGNELEACEFELLPDEFFITNEELDFTVVAVSDISTDGIEVARYGWNRLMGEGKIYKGDRVNIVQHPGGRHKAIAMRANQLVDLLDVHAHYLTDTEPGSSGSPVYNDDWEVIALHHSAVPMIVNGKIMSTLGIPWDRSMDPSQISWIANEGIRISRILNYIVDQDIPDEWELHRTQMMEDVPPHPIELFNSVQRKKPGPVAPQPNGANGSYQWTIPLQISVSIGDIGANQPVITSNGVASQLTNGLSSGVEEEKKRVPYMDPDYSTREGYDENFLGKKVPMPEVIDANLCSKMEDGNHIIPYHHFSLVMNKERRLAYFTASNVDANRDSKRPDKTQKYNRKALAGFGKNDKEMWLVDDRIPGRHQLPDRFYNYDRQSFDKGHIVRRDDVAWGSTYEEVRVANGDTFHVTNCSPQVKHYNRSKEDGIWGEFENFVLKSAKTEKLSVFSGPVFKKNDPEFEGRDDYSKDITVRIPQSYWKVIIAKEGSSLKSYGFVFKQDLSTVQFTEITIAPEFKDYMVPMDKLEKLLDNIKFPAALKKVCQFQALKGKAKSRT